jgi:hypothetical protein
LTLAEYPGIVARGARQDASVGTPERDIVGPMLPPPPALDPRSAGRGTGTVGWSDPGIVGGGAKQDASIVSARRAASNGVPEWDVVGLPIFALAARGAGRGARTIGQLDPGVVTRGGRRGASIGSARWGASYGSPEWNIIDMLTGATVVASRSAGRGASIGAPVWCMGGTLRGASMRTWRGASIGMQRSAYGIEGGSSRGSQLGCQRPC